MKNNKWTEQKVIPFIGEFRQLFSGASIWISMITFIFAAIAAYNTPIMESIKVFIPWLSFPIMLVFVIVAVLILMLLEHKYVQPSVLAYWNQMQYQHNNPLKEDVARIAKQIEVLSKDVEKLKHEDIN